MQGSSSYTKGFFYALFCYICWGVFPLYWHMLISVPSLIILANRMLWSSVFLLAFCIILNPSSLWKIMTKRQNIYSMSIAGLLISWNWGTYIYAVNHQFIVESSLGYYINPLVNVLLGVIFFKEKLNRLEKLSTLLAFIGVVYFTFSYGSFPYIAFMLAISMGIYGMIKKKVNLPPVQALTLETLLITPIAMIYLLFAMNTEQFIISELPTSTSVLLVLGGIVTAVPLLLFASAVKILPYSTMGFIQYIGPTIQLIIGVFIFKEKFTTAHLVCFLCIWTGLLFFTINLIQKSTAKRKITKKLES